MLNLAKQKVRVKMAVILMTMVDEGLTLSRLSALIPRPELSPFGPAPASLIPGAVRARKAVPSDGAGTEPENHTHQRSAVSALESSWLTSNRGMLALGRDIT